MSFAINTWGTKKKKTNKFNSALLQRIDYDYYCYYYFSIHSEFKAID